MRELVEKLLRYQRKARFATKITGPARIAYLSSIFPDARFVHVVRDGRAVVRSLLDVHFWGGTWREREVAWSGGLSDAELDSWREVGEAPLALAALQWRAIIRSARQEASTVAPNRYAELRYEDFVADRGRALDEVTAFCGLPASSEAHELLAERVDPRDMNFRWREAFEPAEIELQESLIGLELESLDYGGESFGTRRPLLSTPFSEAAASAPIRDPLGPRLLPGRGAQERHHGDERARTAASEINTCPRPRALARRPAEGVVDGSTSRTRASDAGVRVPPPGLVQIADVRRAPGRVPSAGAGSLDRARRGPLAALGAAELDRAAQAPS